MLETRLALAVHEWTGLGAGNLWSNSQNWTNGSPSSDVSGDIDWVFHINLIHVTNRVSQNDITGLLIDSIGFDADAGIIGPTTFADGGTSTTGYTFNGNTLSIDTSDAAIRKLGAGRLDLSGDTSYSGTIIDNGSIYVSSNKGLGGPTGGVTVNDPAVLRLVNGITVHTFALNLNSNQLGGGLGTGAIRSIGNANVTIPGKITFLAGAPWTFGVDGPSGLLTVNNNVTLDATSTFHADLAVGVGYDQLAVGGTVDPGGAALTSAVTFVPTLGDTSIVVSNNDVAPSSRTVTVGSDPTQPGKTAVKIVGTDNNDVIAVTQNGSGQGSVKVINGVNKGTFSFTGSIVVDALNGDDNVTVASGITRNTFVLGGTDYNANVTALGKLLDEWKRADANYTTRVTHIKNGGGLNGSYKLNASTVFTSTGLVDTLTGGSGNDLFYASVPPGEVLTDKMSSEQVIDVG